MPPPQQDASIGGELSLRHLPDASDASFSFQIPNVLSKADLLLGDDDMSFLRDDNDSMVTPGPSRTAIKALTLDELTPQPMRTHAETIPRDELGRPQSIHVLDMPSKPKLKQTPQGIGKTLKPHLPTKDVKPRLKVMTQSSQPCTDDASSAATRLETLQAQVTKLNNDVCDEPVVNILFNQAEPLHGVKPRSVKPKRERTIAKTKRTVISGGISKTRSKNTSSTSAFPRHVPSVPNSHQLSLLHPKPNVVSGSGDIVREGKNPDASICSTITDGVAERLVMYGQKLMSSFGPLMSENNTSPPTINPDYSLQTSETIPGPVNVNQFDRSDDSPLTLSQIAPSKPASPLPTSPASVRPPSPMRPSSKRPVSAASTDRAAKKGRNIAAPTDKQFAAAIPAAQHSAGVRALVGSSSSGSRNAHPTTHARDVGTSKKSSRQVHASATRRPVNGSQAEGPAALGRNEASSFGPPIEQFSRSNSLVTSGSSVRSREEGTSTMAESANLPQGDKRGVLPPVNPTKHAEFKFQLDARMEARKAEYEKDRSLASQKTRKQSYQVPDFKTLHALQEAELALRKENIVPVIPLPFELNTDGRAREREKFNEHVREKERELERASEQRRREREENEEREIRELRKKAVPRAHEVPEWYKDAPRIQREKRELESNGD